MDRHRYTTSRRAGRGTDTDNKQERRQMDRHRCTASRAGRWTDTDVQAGCLTDVQAGWQADGQTQIYQKQEGRQMDRHSCIL